MALSLKQPVSAAVLAGGESRRMGTDKALLQVDGIPLLARAIEAVSKVSEDVCVVGDRSAYHRFGVPVVGDDFPGTGTLGGIATALRIARQQHVLVVACDMPLLNVDLLRALVDEPRDYDVLVPRLSNDVKAPTRGTMFEPLHAVYARACLPAIEARLQNGEYTVVGFFEHVDVRVVDEAWLRRFDPELSSFVNTNNRSEFEKALAQFRMFGGWRDAGRLHTVRDYSKFLKDDGRLDVRLLPRPLYMRMVKEYRQQPKVITEVFEAHYWLWDLEETERKLAEAGEEIDRTAIAQEMFGEMEDNEWWKVMESFEVHLQEHFREFWERWTAELDPVYDEQEAAGWIARQ